MSISSIIEFYNSHKGGINGAATGLTIALSILIFGFFRTLFVAICVGLGYYIGKKLENDKDYFKSFLERFLPPGRYR